MIEVMIHVLRTGCPWRDLPSQFGPWSSVYTRFRRWSQAGLWAQVLDLITERAQGKLRFLDATHIKVHQDAANPAGGQHLQAFGRTKGGLKTKLTVDSKGKILQAALAPGQRGDAVAAEEIIFLEGERVVADRGFDSDHIRNRIDHAGGTPCIPPRSNRTGPRPYSRASYRKRHHVENFFQRIKRFRRIGTRYEKLDLHFLAFIHLAGVIDWLR